MMVEAFTDWGSIKVHERMNYVFQSWVDEMFQQWAIVQQDSPFPTWE